MAEKNIEIGGRFHSIATGNVLAGANEILDDDKNKKQSDINTETYTLVNNINERLNGLSPDQHSALTVAAKATNNETKLGYYVCGTEDNVAAKVISDATGYILSKGGSMKIKMTNANTAANATLNINSTGAKPLYYDGERASTNNSWEAGETVEVYYDGTNYYANNVAGGSGSGDGAFDISAKTGQNYETLTAALTAANTILPASKKKGGMSIKYIQLTPAKYTVVKTEGITEQPTGTDIQSDPGIISGTYKASQLSAFSTLPATLNSSLTYYLVVTETVDEQEVTTYTSWVITYAQSSDNKYVQFRYMSSSTAVADFTNVANWQGVDSEPVAGSRNLVESRGVASVFADIIDNTYVSAYGEKPSSNWYVGTPIPIKAGDNIKVICPSDISNNSETAIGVYNQDLTYIEYYALFNRTITVSNNMISLGAKYIRISTRKKDAEQFKVLINGQIVYQGSDDFLKYSIPLIKSNISDIKSNISDIESNISDIKSNISDIESDIESNISDIKFEHEVISLVGQGSTYVSNHYKLIRGLSYVLTFDNPSWERDATGTDPKQYIFGVSSYGGSTNVMLASVTRAKGNIPDKCIFKVPNNSDYVVIGIRANVGEKVTFSIIQDDVNSDVEILKGDVIGSEYLQDNSYITQTPSIAVIDGWYVSKLIPVELGDIIKMEVPDDVTSAVKQKFGTFDEDKNLVDYGSIYNRFLTVSSDFTKYLAFSIRKVDAHLFKIYKNSELVLVGSHCPTGLISMQSDVNEIATEISKFTKELVFKLDSYVNSGPKIVSSDEWYIGTLIPIASGDSILIKCPSDIDAASPYTLGVFDIDKNLIDLWTMFNNRIISPQQSCYLGMSVRKADASKFKLYKNNELVYTGGDVDANFPVLNKKIESLEPEVKTDIFSKNVDKLPILRAASRKGRYLQVIIATDIHGDWKAFQNVVDFSNQCNSIDAVIALGDYPPAHIGSDDFQQFKTVALKSVKPILCIAGNHDVGYENRLIYHTSNDVINNYIIEPTLPFLTDGEHTDGLNYYYHDFVSKKIRMICLFEFDEEVSIIENENWEEVTYDSSAVSYAYNVEYAVGDVVNFGLYTEGSFRCKKAHTSSNTNDIRTRAFHGFRFIGETQANWLVNTLASTPSDFGVVICTHIPSYLQYDEYCRNYKFCEKYRVDTAYYNYHHNDFLGTICDAFNKGISSSMLVRAISSLSYMNTNERDGVTYAYELTYDFTNKNSGARFLCFLAGHTHTDFIMRNSFGQYSIIPRYTDATTRPYTVDDVATTSNNDDIARDAVTVVAFNTDYNNATLTRIGTTATSDGYLRDVERIELLNNN